MSDQAGRPEFEGWAIVELMGHRKLAGYCRQVDLFGGSFLRLDVPGEENEGAPIATQYYGASAIYCITPTTAIAGAATITAQRNHDARSDAAEKGQGQ